MHANLLQNALAKLSDAIQGDRIGVEIDAGRA